MNEIYKERVTMPSWMLALITSGFLVVFLVIGFKVWRGTIMLSAPIIVVFAAVLLIDIIVIMTFRRLEIVVTDTQLIFGFGFIKKKMELRSLSDLTLGEYAFRNYLGYGIRYGRDNTVGYVPRGGRGLRFSVAGEKKPYFITSDRPEELKNTIERCQK